MNFSSVIDFFKYNEVAEPGNLFVLTEEQIDSECRRDQRGVFGFFESLVVGGVGLGNIGGQILANQFGFAAAANPPLLFIFLGGSGLSVLLSRNSYNECKHRLRNGAYQIADSDKARKVIGALSEDLPLSQISKYCQWARRATFFRKTLKWFGKCIDRV